MINKIDNTKSNILPLINTVRLPIVSSPLRELVWR